MKKILFVLLLILSVSVPVSAAESLVGGDITSLPSDWGTLVFPENSSYVTFGEESITMYYNTVGDSGTGKSEFWTNDFDMTDGRFIITADFSVSGTESGQYRSVIIKDNGVLNTVELMRTSGNDISLLRGTKIIEGAVSENKKLSMVFAITMENGTEKECRISLNGENVYSGNIPNWNSKLNIKKASVKFRNYMSKKGEMTGGAEVYKFDVLKSDGVPKIKLFPAEGNMIKPDENSAVTVSCDEPLLNESFKADNFKLLKNDAAIDFNIEESENGCKIQPTDGFEQGAEYKLTIDRIYDSFGNVHKIEKTYTYVAEPEGYKPPRISISPLPESIYSGRSITVTAVAEGENIKITELYIDGEIICSAEKNYLSYDWTPADGKHEIYAKTTDGFGGTGTSETVYLTVVYNEPPQISFDVTGSEVSVKRGEVEQIQINTSDADGIERIELFCDGVYTVSLNEAPYYYDVSKLGMGPYKLKATAYDNCGMSASAEITYSCYNMLYNILWQDDFNSCGEGETPSKVVLISQKGYAKVGESDNEHGKSVLIGMDTVNEDQIGPPYPNISLESCKTACRFECDFYISAKSEYCFTLKKTGSTYMNLFQFDKNLHGCGVEKDYETGRWYKLRIDLNVAKKSVSIYFDGEPFVENYPINADFDIIHHLRVYGPEKDDVKSYIALDNMTLYDVSYSAEITDITSVDSEQPVPYDVSDIRINLTTALDASTVLAENIIIKNGNKIIPVKSVKVYNGGKSIMAVLGSVLNANTEYSVSICGISDAYGNAVPGEICAVFKTTGKSLEVSGLKAVRKGESLEISSEIINNTASDKQLYFVAVLYSGNNIVKVQLIPENCTETEIFNFRLDIPKSGQYWEIAVWDSLTKPHFIGDRIYKFN